MLNNFIYAETKALFLDALNKNEILDEAIVFIEDTKEIWNHGTFFGGVESPFVITQEMLGTPISVSEINEFQSVVVYNISSEILNQIKNSDTIVFNAGTQVIFRRTAIEEDLAIFVGNISLGEITMRFNFSELTMEMMSCNTTNDPRISFSTLTSVNFTDEEKQNFKENLGITDNEGGLKVFELTEDKIESLNDEEQKIILKSEYAETAYNSDVINVSGEATVFKATNISDDTRLFVGSVRVTSSEAMLFIAYVSMTGEISIVNASEKYPFVYEGGDDGKVQRRLTLLDLSLPYDSNKQYTEHLDEVIANVKKNLGIEEVKSTQPLIEITHSELKALRDNAELVPGQQYRITDYITTTTQENTKSANHRFDIIVIADDVNVLNENARACHNDTGAYFSDNGAKLESWEIKYCLDNDKSRFAWADGYVAEWKSQIIANYTIDSGSAERQPYNLDKESYIYESLMVQHPDTGIETPAFYCADPAFYDEGGVDGADIYIYNGTITVDGIEYDSWKKYDDGEGHWALNDWGGLYALTERLVYNNEIVWPSNSNVENGKGVIYYMKDEWGNECPYDFKNIQFYHNDFEQYVYTFTLKIDSDIHDASVLPISYYNNNLDSAGVYNNSIKPYMKELDDENAGLRAIQTLNNITFITPLTDSSNIQYGGCYGNTFGCNCNNIVFGDQCNNNTFGKSCHDNVFVNECYNNVFGDGFSSNNFLSRVYDNSFGTECTDNTFREDIVHHNSFGNGFHLNFFLSNCINNIFGSNSDSNTFGESCINNIFGNSFCRNVFGDFCTDNIFGNNCYNNKCLDDFINNSFGNNCYSNSFGNNCKSNSFGNNCYSNTFEDSCSYNSFGNHCTNNTFGKNCMTNVFDVHCIQNVFGNNYQYNRFGPYCRNISFKLNADKDAETLDYC